MISSPPERLNFQRYGLSDGELLRLYEHLLFPRMVEEKMLILLRQNKISKWFSGIGQEAVSVGLTAALQPEDYIYTLHRNLGVFTTREVPLQQLMCQWQGKPCGFTQGRDRSFHFGTPRHRIIGMISHLGAMLGVADGTALAAKLKDEAFISAVFSGDGGASEGDFHEAINVAAVWDLPVMFVVENNGYGLSTPSSEQFRCKQFIDKAIGYGVEAVQVEGNNVVEVYTKALEAARYVRETGRPLIFEALTFRRRGHEEASGTKYVPQDLMAYWEALDPIDTYEAFLLAEGVLSGGDVEAIRKRFKAVINEAWKAAEQQSEPIPNMAKELAEVYAPEPSELRPPDWNQVENSRFVDAISDGLRAGMDHDPQLVLMGQDIAEYGGVFKVTDGFLADYGRERVRNTPLCESAILAAALGLSIEGIPSMVEMQFADFVSCGFNQIINNLAKTHYRWATPARVVIRMPTGAGVAAGPFHSQSTEAWFAHVPGLKVVYPATPADAKGLLTTALQDPNPVLFFEHKYLYRREQGAVPEGYYNLPIGPARLAREGNELSVVTYGQGVHWALEWAEDNPACSVEIVDLRTLLPWDRETVFASVRKTGKALVFHEDTLTGGIGGEVAASIAEHCFESLDGPVRRVGALDTPVPFHTQLEEQFLPRERFRQAAMELWTY